MPPLLVSVSPYVPQRSSPYAGHQWYFQFLASMARHYEVVVLAPPTEQNRAAGTCSDWRVLEAPGIGHWRRSERQRGPLDKLRDELLGGVVHLDGSARRLLADAFVIDVQWPRALPHVRALRAAAPRASLTYMAHDLHHTNWQWRRLRRLPLAKRVVGAGIGPVVARRELSLIGSCDVFFAFKQADIDAVASRGVRTPGIRLAPWLERPTAPVAAPGGPPEVLYTAAFDRAQNRWGADWLLEQVWPRVRAERPDARLVLAGGGAPADLLAAVERTDGVSMTGFVADLGPVYAGARCVVAPVLGGAGMRFKVPQAMVYERPLVVTPLALEGLEEAPADAFVAVSDDPTAFAAGILRALRDDPAVESSAVRGRRWVEAEFSFDASMDAVVEAHHRHRP